MKIGLEFHRILDHRKLFCSCRYKKEDSLTDSFSLNLEDVVHEFHNGNCFCRVEREESPPILNHLVFKKAISCLQGVPGLKILNRVVFSRKKILDGTLCNGYQRTALVGYGGQITLKNGRVIKIEKAYLEEDSATKWGSAYTVSRMGLPLIELVTEPLELTYEETVQLLEQMDGALNWNCNLPISSFCRRQDLNLSMEGKPRVEYKGVDKFSTLKKILLTDIYDGETVHNVDYNMGTYYYDEATQKRVFLREYLGTKRMSYQTQVGVIKVPLRWFNRSSSRFKRLTRVKSLLTKDLSTQMKNNLQKTFKNKKSILKLHHLHKKFDLKKFDFSVLDFLKGAYKSYLSYFKGYLQEEYSYQGLKVKQLLKPLKLTELNLQVVQKDYKGYKKLLPRSFFIRNS